jgi:hypothetical protein
MECPYCVGREPAWEREDNSADEAPRFSIIFNCVTWKGVHQGRSALRLIHRKHSFVIEIRERVSRRTLEATRESERKKKRKTAAALM